MATHPLPALLLTLALGLPLTGHAAEAGSLGAVASGHGPTATHAQEARHATGGGKASLARILELGAGDERILELGAGDERILELGAGDERILELGAGDEIARLLSRLLPGGQGR